MLDQQEMRKKRRKINMFGRDSLAQASASKMREYKEEVIKNKVLYNQIDNLVNS